MGGHAQALHCSRGGLALPELPEVETVAADLRPHLVGRVINGCEVRHPAVVRHPDPELFAAGVTGRRIEEITRRGKYILFRLDSGELLVVHLGMTGQLRYVTPEVPLLTHTHAILTLDGGAELRYRDIRRFGRLLFGTEEELVRERKLPRLGPEPIDPEFKPIDLMARLKNRRAPVKALLLDQSVVAGVGNIYADESLFKARLRPDRPAGSLSRPAVIRLHDALRDSLLAGIRNRGSSVDDYVDAWGEKGSQQEQLLVYGRAGEPCVNCGRPLGLVRIGGRSTVFCRRCQR
ncbi:MAG TPA: bifunctional DNA-formamidopyrimidine glycosylase/DNA-(apurinic or apyrimidinic site) lyase [Candidatus Dormibacteraeota bacterium]